MSRFNLSWKQFLKLTPLEFFLAIQDQEDIEVSKIKIQCEAIRTSAWYLLNVQLKRGVRKPQKLFEFPWDWESEKEPQTLQQMKGVMKAIASGTKRKKK